MTKEPKKDNTKLVADFLKENNLALNTSIRLKEQFKDATGIALKDATGMYEAKVTVVEVK